MSEVIDNTRIIEHLKVRLLASFADLEECPKGDMTLYIPSKNIRFYVSNKQKVMQADYKKFETNAIRLKNYISIFVSIADNIPYQVETEIVNDEPVLYFYVTIGDVTDRFIEMLQLQDDIGEDKEKSLALDHLRKKPKESLLNNYESTVDGFNAYCLKVPYSKIEYEKAKLKWISQMSRFDSKNKFIEYLRSIRPAKEEAQTSNATKDQFLEYIRNTPLSKITKKDITERFSSLPTTITHTNLSGNDFKNKMKAIKASLS